MRVAGSEFARNSQPLLPQPTANCFTVSSVPLWPSFRRESARIMISGMTFIKIVCTVALICLFISPCPGAALASDDVLPAASKWEGTEHANDSHANTANHHCSLTIKSRSDTHFVAEYSVGDQGQKLKLEGVIANDGTIKCMVTEVIHGKFGRDVLKDTWRGKLDGDDLVLEHAETDGGTRKSELERKSGKKG